MGGCPHASPTLSSMLLLRRRLLCLTGEGVLQPAYSLARSRVIRPSWQGLASTRHPANNIDHDCSGSTQGCTNTATLMQAEPNHDCLTMIVWKKHGRYAPGSGRWDATPPRGDARIFQHRGPTRTRDIVAAARGVRSVLMFQRGPRPRRGRPRCKQPATERSVESGATCKVRRKRTSAGVARSQVEPEGESYKVQRGWVETRCSRRRRGRW
jgi:hypothetical protein